MSDLIRDGDLDQMIRNLNRDAPDRRSEGGTRSDDPVTGTAYADGDDENALANLLAHMTARGATDLLLVPGSPPVLRIDGDLVPLDSAVLNESGVRSMLRPHADDRHLALLRDQGSSDLSLRLRGKADQTAYRFRVNIHRQRGGLAASVRALPRRIPTFADLSLPGSLAAIARVARGLVLVCGPTGAGKSTTLAAIVGEINRVRRCHVITIEDPVEYDHPRGMALVEQIEVGTDVPSFGAALKAALRQDPDVLLVGEMRDLETIAIALTAAETGHLVLSTLHTADVAQSVHRIVDVFPAAQQGQIRHQLALGLHTIVCQQLLPRASGDGRIAAVEVLIANSAVRQHIRSEREHNLYNEIVLGKRAGMMTFEESLANLVRAGAVSRDDALVRAGHPAEFESLLRLG